MCTRCVRFTREISQTGELQVMRRGNHAEIDVFPGEPIDNPLSGNVVDLCPVGALLDKDFLHKQRAWFLSKHDAICTRCSTGCNVKAEENRGQVWRFTPRFNPEVNDHWICDEGRMSYKAANDPGLLASAYARSGGELGSVPLDQALNGAGQALGEIARDGGVVAGVISPFLTVEEAFLMATYLKGLNPANVLAIGPVPTRGEDVKFEPDQKEGRGGDTSFIVPRPFTIHAEKCPNRKGVEAVLDHVQGEVISFEAIFRPGLRPASSRRCTSLQMRLSHGSKRRKPTPLREWRRASDRPGHDGDSFGPDWPILFFPARRSPRRRVAMSTGQGRLQYAEATAPAPRWGLARPRLVRHPERSDRGRTGPVAGCPRRSRFDAISAFAVADGGHRPRVWRCDRQ